MSSKAAHITELEERLVRGTYRFGEALSIYTLAEQFGASRQPVASAVLYLRSVGYLEIIPQVGCRVVAPTNADLQPLIGRMLASGGIERTTTQIALTEQISYRVLPLVTGDGDPA